MAGDPIDGQTLLLVAAKASVGPRQLPDLVDVVQADLRECREQYRREYELAHETDDYAAFFVEDGHWEEIGERVGFDDRERDAVRRAHHEQLRRDGRRVGRREEFETALEIRACVLVGTVAVEKFE
ncbi:hypothetical protein [Halorientalis litorea]|jgi:hypothetical protein|uniref:hypothetical protein n=1 Tax=Halorientalis litorea TaxID=2931977 RepID=UPI001FF6A75E|nr:hypothetical protein [Halorientalis litorea]